MSQGDGQVWPGNERSAAASATKRRTAGLVSPLRQATHIVVGGSPALGTKQTPGRPWNLAAEAGHRLMPCPAATCSHQSSTVRAVAPTIGTSPPGRGRMSQSSCQARASQPSVARSAVTNGRPATSASVSFSRVASRCPAGSTNTRGSEHTADSSIAGAATGARTSPTSLLWSSRPAAGWVISKVLMLISTSGYARSKAVSNRVLASFSHPAPTPTASLPVTARAALRAAVTPRSRLASVSRAVMRKASPARVSVTPLFVLCSSWVPTASSSWRICVDRTCCVTWTRCAAAVKLASSATATKYLRWRSSMFIAGSSY